MRELRAKKMNCYGSKRQQLPPLGRAVLMSIDRARGVYRSEGLRAREVAADLNRVAREVAIFPVVGRRYMAGFTAQEIGLAFAWLKRAGFIVRGVRGWRRA